MIYRIIAKRMLDIAGALTILLLSTPFFLLTIITLWLLNEKVFFIQQRPGMNEKIFHIIKFKTMNDKSDIYGNLLPDEQRLTSLGQIIRKTSLDELPQLINVLKGDMSLVGPRPLLSEYLPLYNNEQRKRHNVKPGITGWAQVNGRNSLNWRNKFDKDIYYVDNISFILDLKIILLTIKKVFKAEGISQEGHVSMSKFSGNI